jgi:hypothetical protein
MTTEGEALANILTWSADSPGWQRDALRRLVTQAALEPTEIDELVAICKGDSPAVPLEAGHLRNPNREGEVYLRQLHTPGIALALSLPERLGITGCVALRYIGWPEYL